MNPFDGNIDFNPNSPRWNPIENHPETLPENDNNEFDIPSFLVDDCAPEPVIQAQPILVQQPSKEELLVEAALIGDTQKVRKLLSEKVSPNASVNVKTYIELCDKHKLDIAEFKKIIEPRPDVLNASLYVLSLATIHRQIWVLSTLLSAGANVDVIEFITQHSPLQIAAKKNRKDDVVLILGYNPMSEMKNRSGETALELTTDPEIKNLIIKYNEKREQLVKAVIAGNELDVRKLLNAHVSPNILVGQNIIPDAPYGMTLLKCAIDSGNLTIIELLLKAGANVNLWNATLGGTLLHTLAYSGHKKVVELVLKYNPRTDIRDNSGQTPGRIASRNAELDTVFKKHEQTIQNLPHLLTALHSRDLNRFSSWLFIVSPNVIVDGKTWNESLRSGGFDGEYVTQNSSAPLLCYIQDIKAIDILLNHGADINASSSSGQTLLHYAARSENAVLIKYLLQKKVPTDIRDNFGQTACDLAKLDHIKKLFTHPESNQSAPLQTQSTPPSQSSKEALENKLIQAVGQGNISEVKKLLEANVSPNLIIDSKNTHFGAPGHSVLDLAIASQNEPIIKLLLNANADINLQEKMYGYTPLHTAVSIRSAEIVELILKHNPKLDIRNKQGQTALDLASTPKIAALLRQHIENPDNLVNAVISGNELEVRKLLNAKAPPNVLINNEITPEWNQRLILEYAVHINNVPIIEMLLKAGANVNIRNEQSGETLLHKVVCQGQKETVDLFLRYNARTDLRDHEGRTARELVRNNPEIGSLFNRHEETKKNLPYLLEALHKDHFDRFLSLASTILPNVIIDGKTWNESIRSGGFDIGCVMQDFSGPLICYLNKAKYIGLLVHIGADINGTSSQGETLLHIAAKNGRYILVKFLLRRGVRRDIKDNNGKTAHDVAKTVNIKRLFEKYESNQSVSLQTQPTPPLESPKEALEKELVQAVLSCNEFEVRRLLDADVSPNVTFEPTYNSQRIQYENIMELAICNQHKSIIEMLIRAGVHIDTQGKVNGNTPLHIAIRTRNTEIVKLILGYNPNTKIRNRAGEVVRQYAIGRQMPEIIKLLELHASSIKYLPNLLAAFHRDDIDGFKDLLTKKVSPNIRIGSGTWNTYQRNTLHRSNYVAVGFSAPIIRYIQQLNYVEVLLNRGADIDGIAETDGSTSLHAAAHRGDHAMVSYLLYRNARTDIKDFNGKTALEVARTPEIVELFTAHQRVPLLTQAGTPPRPTQEELEKEFVQAIYNGKELEVRKLLDSGVSPDLILDSKNNPGGIQNKSILEFAIYYTERLPIIEMLLQAGASIDIQGKASGNTPLHVAVNTKKTSIVELILKYNPKTDIKNSLGDTALDYAKDQPEILSLINQYILSNNRFLLLKASHSDYLNEFNRLLSTGISPNVVITDSDWNCFQNDSVHKKYNVTAGIPAPIICYMRRVKFIQALLDCGADINAISTGNGSTALHFAASRGDLAGVTYLLSRNARTDIKNFQGKTALDVAKNHQVEALIRKHMQTTVQETAPKPPGTTQSVINEAIAFGGTPAGIPHVQKACKSLYELIQLQYKNKHSKELVTHLSDNKGRWGIDFAQELPGELSKKRWLKPFKNLLRKAETSNEKKAAIYAVKLCLSFFRFSDSSLNMENITSRRAIVDFCLAENSGLEKIQEAELSESLAEETAPTLMWLKMVELKMLLNHPQKYHLSQPAAPTTRPCYMLVQDVNNVRVFLMRSHHDHFGFVESFGSDPRDESFKFLTEKFVPSESLIQQFQEAVVVSFHDSEKINPSSGALVLKRQSQANYFNAEKKRKKTSEKRTSRTTDLESSRSKRARTPTHSSEEHSPLTLEALVDSGESRKRAAQKERGRTPKRGCQGFQDLEFNHAYIPLSEEVDLEINSSSSSSSVSKKAPKLPPVSNSERTVLDNFAVQDVTPENFYSMIGQHSLHEVRAEVIKEVEKEAVIHGNVKPLHYPIESQLDLLPVTPTPFIWNRRLKGYQIEALAEILKTRLAGLSTLLSLDMGLGKTITFSEYIIQLISQSPDPKIHIVIAPASLTLQHFADLPLHFMESVIVAWQLTGKTATAAHYEQLYNEYFADADNPKSLVSFLRIFPYFNVHNANAKQRYRQFISQPNLQKRIVDAIREHLNDIDQQISDTPSLKDAYTENYKAALETIQMRSSASHQELLSYFEKITIPSTKFQRFCTFAGKLLNLHPGRVPLPDSLPEHDDSTLSPLRALGFTSAQMKKAVFNDLKAANEELTSHRIIITTYEKLFAALGLKESDSSEINSSNEQILSLQDKPIGSLVVDEVSLAHTASSMTSKHLRQSIDKLGLRSDSSSHNNVLLVTGTPFENKLLELWTLIGTANGKDKLPISTYKTLVRLFQMTIRKLIALKLGDTPESNNEAINYILRSFAHFAKFRNVIEKIMFSRKKTDSKIIEQWHSRISKGIHETINGTIDPDLTEKINEEFSSNERGAFIKRYRAKCKLLIHPDLENASIVAPNQNEQAFSPKSIFGQNAGLSKEQIDSWIYRSPELNAILTHQIFLDAVRNNEKIIIVTEYQIQSSLFKHSIEHLFSSEFPKLKTFEFGGMKSVDERTKTLTKFKNRKSGKPSVLMLMLKSGGQGLNIPQADTLFLLPTPWNPGQEQQAINRVIRANETKTKKIVHLIFSNIRVSEHPQLIQQKKRSWESFLMQNVSSNRELLQLWSKILESETLLEYFRFKGASEVAFDESKSIVEFLRKSIDSISDIRLDSFLRSAGANSIQTSESASSLNESLQTVTIGDPVGFRNAAANCWCNALLQMVVSIPQLEESYIYFAEHYTRQNSIEGVEWEMEHRNALKNALTLYREALTHRYPLDSSITQKVREALAYFFPGEISSNADQQEDLSVAFRLIVGACMVPGASHMNHFSDVETARTYSPTLNKRTVNDRDRLIRTLRNLPGDKYDIPPENNTSIVTNKEATVDIYLQGEEDKNFEQLFQKTFLNEAPEAELTTYLIAENGYYHLRPHKVETIAKRYVQAPTELFLSLQLFGHNIDGAFKICRQLDIPLQLTLPAGAIKDSNETPSYELDSFVVHEGKSLETGHYYTYKKVNGVWWICNDDRVSRVPDNTIEALLQGQPDSRTTTYLHHYHRREA